MKRAYIILLSIIILPIFSYTMDSEDSCVDVTGDSFNTASTSTDPDSPKSNDDQASYFIALHLSQKEPITSEIETALLHIAQSRAQRERYKRKKRYLEEEDRNTKAIIDQGNRWWKSMKKRAEYLEHRIQQERSKKNSYKESIVILEGRLKKVLNLMEDLDIGVQGMESKHGRIKRELKNVVEQLDLL